MIVELTLFRPLMSLVTPFKVSTVDMAGPTLNQSTKMKLGADPYCVVQLEAALPRLPASVVSGLFVVEEASTFGDSMPKS